MRCGGHHSHTFVHVTQIANFLQSQADAAHTRSEQQSLVDEKAELQAVLRARFQIELWGGLEALAAAAARGSSSVSDRELLEASACYQAVYRWVGAWLGVVYAHHTLR